MLPRRHCLKALSKQKQSKNSDLAKVVNEFDRVFAQMQDDMERVKEAQRLVEISAQAAHDSRPEYHRLASAFDEAEGSLNEGLGCVRKAQETGARTRQVNSMRLQFVPPPSCGRLWLVFLSNVFCFVWSKTKQRKHLDDLSFLAFGISHSVLHLFSKVPTSCVPSVQFLRMIPQPLHFRLESLPTH